MKKKRNRIFALSTLLFVLSTIHIKAQTSKFSFNLGYGIGIENYTEVDILPPTVFDSPEDPYPIGDVPYTSWLCNKVTLGAEYKVLSFLSGGLALDYAWFESDGGWEGNAEYSTSSHLEVTDFRIQPMLSIDLLFNSENEALNLGAGLNFYKRSSRSFHSAESDTVAAWPLKNLILDRRGWGTSYFLQLEWEDYFAPNFGYFISFRWFPSYSFEPAQLEVEEYTLKGRTINDGTVYDLEGNSFQSASETFVMGAIYFNIGLKYRL